LGAGKTCLTQGIASGLDVAGYVRSPTFVLMSRYLGRLTLYHVDLYRIGSAAEAWDLGLDEQLFGHGVCVVEWADRATELFPEESLWIALDHVSNGNQRTISFSESPALYCPVLKRLAAAFPVPKEVRP
jgi:tRNA threonylcarbamoyladenosine biosynthesis protein TsaE